MIYLDVGEDYGDAVACMGCEKVMLVEIGAERCPFCKGEGTMAWLEGMAEKGDFEQEMSLELFERACEIEGYC